MADDTETSKNGSNEASSSEDEDEDDSNEDKENSHNPPPLTALEWVKQQMIQGVRPEEVLRDILGTKVQLPVGADDVSLWEAVLELIVRPIGREPLDRVTSLDDVVRLIKQSQKIMVLSGAGISVSCGIPDFRSPNGLYATLAVRYPELPDPQAMFDIKFFQLDPHPFFTFAKEIFPGKYEPSVSHKFIKALETKGKLLRNYTQNIDTLEQAAGIKRVIYCHGSFMSATCRNCKNQVDIEIIKDDIMNERIPYCTECNQTKSVESDDDEVMGIMKPDIVFFGEGLPDTFHEHLQNDKTEVDLLIVMGSSLKVRPVSLIPDVLPTHVPRILINREPLQYIQGFDVRLLGYSDTIVTELCRRLGKDWIETLKIQNLKEAEVRSPEERIHVFEGGIWKMVSPAAPEEQDSIDDEISTDTNNHCVTTDSGIANLKRTHSDNESDNEILSNNTKMSRTSNKNHNIDNYYEDET